MIKTFKDIRTGDKLYYQISSTGEFGDCVADVVYPFIFIRQLKTEPLEINLREHGHEFICLVDGYHFYSDFDLFCRANCSTITHMLEKISAEQHALYLRQKDLEEDYKVWYLKAADFSKKYLSLNN